MPSVPFCLRATRCTSVQSFTNIGGQARNNIAALDATTAAATSWNPSATGGATQVTALALDGTTLFAGGMFTSIGGQSRDNLAALDTSTGVALAFDAGSNQGGIATLAIRGSTLYVGGIFANLGGQPRKNIAVLDKASGTATSWSPAAADAVSVIVAGP